MLYQIWHQKVGHVRSDGELKVRARPISSASRGKSGEIFGHVNSVNLTTPDTGELGDGDYFSAVAMRPSGIRPRPLDAGNLNRGLCVKWVSRIGYEDVAERMCLRKCVRMHKCPHVSTDM